MAFKVDLHGLIVFLKLEVRSFILGESGVVPDSKAEGINCAKYRDCIFSQCKPLNPVKLLDNIGESTVVVI